MPLPQAQVLRYVAVPNHVWTVELRNLAQSI